MMHEVDAVASDDNGGELVAKVAKSRGSVGLNHTKPLCAQCYCCDKYESVQIWIKGVALCEPCNSGRKSKIHLYRHATPPGPTQAQDTQIMFTNKKEWVKQTLPYNKRLGSELQRYQARAYDRARLVERNVSSDLSGSTDKAGDWVRLPRHRFVKWKENHEEGQFSVLDWDRIHKTQRALGWNMVYQDERIIYEKKNSTFGDWKSQHSGTEHLVVGQSNLSGTSEIENAIKRIRLSKKPPSP